MGKASLALCAKDRQHQERERSSTRDAAHNVPVPPDVTQLSPVRADERALQVAGIAFTAMVVKPFSVMGPDVRYDR